MSEVNRAWNIVRGYVGREWDRVNTIEMSTSEQELMESLSSDTPAPAHQSTPLPIQTEHPDILARKVLGVSEQAGFLEINKKKNALLKRCAAAEFPVGSADAKMVSDLKRRIDWAFKTLSDPLDSTEKRFGTLEIE